MQDKILGPLTMVQFVYAVIGGGVCYGIFSAVHAPYSFFLITPIALFVLAMIFLKINERPFLNFLVSFIEFSATPKKRYWHHEDYASNLTITLTSPANATTLVAPTKNISRDQIRDLAQRIDEGQNGQ